MLNRTRPGTARGFTLIELMIAVAVIALLAGIALPLYNGYIQTSREGVLVTNIEGMRIFQEDFRLRNNRYAEGSYTAGAADADLAELGWDPGADNIDYVVVANAAVSYTVTATDEAGTSVCRQFPGGAAC